MTELREIKPPLIAILRGIKPEEIESVGTALVEAGFRIIEVTMNSPEPLESIAKLSERHGEQVLIGAGTVLRPDEVDAVAAAGGRLIVSPNFNPAVVARTLEKGMYSVPGCLTPTEVFAGLEAGASMIKIFPGLIATPAVVKALRAVTPPDSLLAVTGGVSLENISAYKAAGASGLGISNALYTPGMSAADVGKNARTFVEAYAA